MEVIVILDAADELDYVKLCSQNCVYNEINATVTFLVIYEKDKLPTENCSHKKFHFITEGT